MLFLSETDDEARAEKIHQSCLHLFSNRPSLSQFDQIQENEKGRRGSLCRRKFERIVCLSSSDLKLLELIEILESEGSRQQWIADDNIYGYPAIIIKKMMPSSFSFFIC